RRAATASPARRARRRRGTASSEFMRPRDRVLTANVCSVYGACIFLVFPGRRITSRGVGWSTTILRRRAVGARMARRGIRRGGEGGREPVRVGGLRFVSGRRGAVPPLLLLQGAVCDGRVWRRQLDALSDAFTVIAWDAPGGGGSSDPPAAFRMPDYGACVAAF